MDNHGHGEMHMMATPLWNALVLVGFHILIFTCTISGSQSVQKKKII
jgi:hypothetical protein